MTLLFPLLSAVNNLPRVQRRFQSSYFGRLRSDADRAGDASYIRELLYRHDPEAVIRLFERPPSFHSDPAALKEYVKALVKADRLDESELLKTLQRGN